MLWPNRFLADPMRPYGRIDLGGDDELAVLEGWHRSERDGNTTFRWASREAAVRVALDHAATLRVQVRGQAFVYPSAPPQTMTVSVNGVAGSPAGAASSMDHGGDGGAVGPLAGWGEPGAAHVRARHPSVGCRACQLIERELSAAIDYLRVVVEP